MLIYTFSYLLFTIIFFPIIVIKYIHYKKKNAQSRFYKIFALIIFFVGITLLFTNSFFPLPFQKSIIENKIHSVKNFIIPFQRIVQQYIYVQNSNMDMKIFIAQNIIFFIKNIFIYFCISFLLCMYKVSSKHILSLLFLSISIEILQFITGIIIGLNYKSVSTEDAILAFIGLYLGYLLYQKIAALSNTWKNDSNIMLLIDRLFIAHKL